MPNAYVYAVKTSVKYLNLGELEQVLGDGTGHAGRGTEALGRQRVPWQCRPGTSLGFSWGRGLAVEGERLAASMLSLFCQRVSTS